MQELKVRYGKVLQKPVELIIKAIDSLAVLGSVTLSLVDHQKRRNSRIELHKEVQAVLKTFRPFIDDRNVKVYPNLCNANPYFMGRKAAVESIITNLINNSLAALERCEKPKREIHVHTVIEGDSVVLRVLDNGPGIDGIRLSDIWLPGRTTRENGTGLGLTIVRDAVKDLGGNVSASEHSEIGGAEFRIEFPILGA